MADLKKYKIDIFNLPAGNHEYEFEFNNDFFENFENSLIKIGHGGIKVGLKKSETFLELDFFIEGTIELICDRSLDRFDYPVKVQKDLIIKFEEETDSSDDEIVFIPWNTQSIQLEQYIYEFLSLEIPMKKLHPRYADDFDEDQEEKLIYTSDPDVESDRKKDQDPRWQILEQLIDTDTKKASKK